MPSSLDTGDGGDVDLPELDDDLLMEMPLDDDEMGGDVMPSSLDTGDGAEANLPLDDFEFSDDDLSELDDDLLTDLPDLDDDAALTVTHNDTTAVKSVVTAATGMDDILSDVKALDPDLVDGGWEF